MELVENNDAPLPLQMNGAADALITPAEIKTMIDRIHGMREEEHLQIFSIIRNETSKYTKNLNGVFVNMAHLEQNTLQKMRRFIEYLGQQRQRIAESDSMLSSIRKTSDEYTMKVDVDKPCDEVSAYIGTLNLCAPVEESVPSVCLQDLNSTEQNIISVEQTSRKRDLTLNRAKPKFSGTSARIARKCQGEMSEVSSAL